MKRIFVFLIALSFASLFVMLEETAGIIIIQKHINYYK